MADLRPIAFFDSGLGGISVLRETVRLLPEENYLYYGDSLHAPYGVKTVDEVIARSRAIVQHLLDEGAKAIVIACNTASTVSLPALREKFAFPVVGVVPAIKPAARLTANGIVGLLATRGTVKRPYTRELIDRFANECRIEMLGSAELVELAEAKLHGEPVPLEELRRILRPWLRMQEPPDTVVLGCTHFPLLQEELQRVLPEGTRLIDSGAAIARRTAWLLEHEAPDAKSSDENKAFCMALTAETEQLLPVLRRYGFSTLEKLPL